MRATLLYILILLSAISYGRIPEDTCRGEYHSVLKYGDTVVINCDYMVLLNSETFAKYYHDSKSLGELRLKVPEWSSKIDSVISEMESNRRDMDSIVVNRERQLELERESKEEVISDLIVSLKENKALRKKNKRLKKIGIGGCSFSLILLLILI